MTKARGRRLAAATYRQHGAVARRQLLELGYTRHKIQHLIDVGHLHVVWRGLRVTDRRLARDPSGVMADVRRLLERGPGT